MVGRSSEAPAPRDTFSPLSLVPARPGRLWSGQRALGVPMLALSHQDSVCHFSWSYSHLSLVLPRTPASWMQQAHSCDPRVPVPLLRHASLPSTACREGVGKGSQGPEPLLQPPLLLLPLFGATDTAAQGVLAEEGEGGSVGPGPALGRG